MKHDIILEEIVIKLNKIKFKYLELHNWHESIPLLEEIFKYAIEGKNFFSYKNLLHPFTKDIEKFIRIYQEDKGNWQNETKIFNEFKETILYWQKEFAQAILEERENLGFK